MIKYLDSLATKISTILQSSSFIANLKVKGNENNCCIVHRIKVCMHS